MQDDGGYQHAKYSQANPVLNRWYHIVGVRDGNIITIYVDGVAGATTDTVGILTSEDVNTWSIGRLSDDPSYHRYFNGLIDEVRVYNRALSAEEIGELYRAGARKMQIRN